MVLNPAGKVLTIDVSRMGTLPFVTSYYPILTINIISFRKFCWNQLALQQEVHLVLLCDKSIRFGRSGDGGYQICSSGGTRWIVAPDSAINTRTAQQFNDAINAANKGRMW